MRKKNARKRNSRKRLFRLIAFAGLLPVLVFLFFTSDSLHKLVFETMGPLQKAASTSASWLHTFKTEYLDIFQSTFRLREENKRLLDQLQEKESQLGKAREAMATNAMLRKLLSFKEELERPVVPATIIGKDPSAWFRSVIIDQGTNSGLSKGDPVISSNGVVGQVFTVSPNYAKVLLAIAPSSAIDVLLQKSRVRGILKGDGTMTYRLEYILRTADVKEGDYVVTAGYGGVFPTGLPVGKVSKIIQKPRGMFHEIEVTPAVDYQTLEHLLVIPQVNPDELKQLSWP